MKQGPGGLAALAGGLIGALSLLGAGMAQAADRPGLTGEYVCASGCRLTDALPSIVIDGDVAHCTNELGGTYTGRVLARDRVFCFNKTGTLSADGKTILWSNGAVWTRR